MNFGYGQNPTEKVAPAASYALSYGIGMRWVRATPRLPILFPTATTVNFDAMDEFRDKLAAAGLRMYLNPVQIPAWASGGKPAYVEGVRASAAQTLAVHGHGDYAEVRAIFDRMNELVPDPLIAFDGSRWPDKRAEIIPMIRGTLIGGAGVMASPDLISAAAWLAQQFVDSWALELGGSWAWNTPLSPNVKQEHVWGAPGFAEADAISAPRPWLLPDGLPHVDPKAVQYMGEVLGERYGEDVAMWGTPINEPDINLFNPPIAYDAVNGGTLGDTVKNRLLPEVITPYIIGVEAGAIRAAMDLTRPGVFVGYESAYPGTLERLVEVDHGAMEGYSVHMYGADKWPGGSYEHIEEYRRIWNEQHIRLRLCGEVDGPPHLANTDGYVSIIDWLRHVLTMDTGLAAIFLYDASKIIDGFYEEGAKENFGGTALREIAERVNGKRRAAGGK